MIVEDVLGIKVRRKVITGRDLSRSDLVCEMCPGGLHIDWQCIIKTIQKTRALIIERRINEIGKFGF